MQGTESFAGCRAPVHAVAPRDFIDRDLQQAHREPADEVPPELASMRVEMKQQCAGQASIGAIDPASTARMAMAEVNVRMTWPRVRIAPPWAILRVFSFSSTIPFCSIESDLPDGCGNCEARLQRPPFEKTGKLCGRPESENSVPARRTRLRDRT